MRLHHESRKSAILADGSLVHFDTYSAEVLWHDEWIVVSVDEADTDPLIGMALLDGSSLHVEARRGGTVTIAPLR